MNTNKTNKTNETLDAYLIRIGAKNNKQKTDYFGRFDRDE